MSRTSLYSRRCPCGNGGWETEVRPAVAVTLQMTTVGGGDRRRAPAITIYPCTPCIQAIHTKTGRKLRIALAKAIVKSADKLAIAPPAKLAKGRRR